MRFAYPMQKIQDWLTQQWVIFWGRRIDPKNYAWLMGPFGNLQSINENYITQLAEKEKLFIDRTNAIQGLIPSMNLLNLSVDEFSKLSGNIVGFYEKTSKYDLNFSVEWNPFFKIFGVLLKHLFSNRINQLNIPTNNIKNSEAITSEIITLSDAQTNQTKYIFWLRNIKSNGQAIYSGAYGVCKLPSGKTCIKAVFPLPNGNATVIMIPKVGPDGELVLESSGKKFGDAGFYFLLRDSKGDYWSQFIRSFRDELIVKDIGTHLLAEQKLTLWNKNVLKFNYEIHIKK